LGSVQAVASREHEITSIVRTTWKTSTILQEKALSKISPDLESS
jgi:hypothetical protein